MSVLNSNKRLLFSIHGIRTLGAWQDTLKADLSGHGWKYEAFKFGNFPISKLLWSYSRQRIVERFHNWYVREHRMFEPDDKRRLTNRPSIVAHSFGAYVVGECMLKYREVKFDKIILCGAILPREFGWPELLARNQVWRVRNEFGSLDRWAKVVGHFVPETGDSGYAGFNIDSPCITQQQFDYHEHSDYFRVGHSQEYWLPFLEEKSLQVYLRNGSDFREEAEFLATLNRTHEIDLECFGRLPSFHLADIPRGLSTTWIHINPDIYTFLFADEPAGRAVGYINAMPVREEVFRRIVAGKLNDNEISSDDVVPFDRGGEMFLYLMSIVVDPGARRIGQGIYQEAFELLTSGLEDKLLGYWRRFGTRVVELGAVGWTPEGRHLCEALGLVRCGTDKQQNPTYSMRVSDAARRRGRLGGLLHRLKTGYDGAAMD